MSAEKVSAQVGAAMMKWAFLFGLIVGALVTAILFAVLG